MEASVVITSTLPDTAGGRTLSALYGGRAIVASPVNGVIWLAVAEGVNNSTGAFCKLYRSENDGATWVYVQTVSMTPQPLIGNPCTIVLEIDASGYLHLVHNAGATLNVWSYRRGTLQGSAGSYSWSFSSDYTVAGSYVSTAPCVRAHATASGWAVHLGIDVQQYESGTTTYAAYAGYNRVNITSGGSISIAYGGSPLQLSPMVNVGANRQEVGVPQLDFNHTGDGYTMQGGSPEVVVIYNSPVASTTAKQPVYVKKLTYSSGTSWTLGDSVLIDNSGYLQPTGGWWTGTKFVCVGKYSTLYASFLPDAAIVDWSPSAGATKTVVAWMESTIKGAVSTIGSDGSIYTVTTNGIERYHRATGRSWPVYRHSLPDGNTIDELTMCRFMRNGKILLAYSDFPILVGSATVQPRFVSLDTSIPSPTDTPTLAFPLSYDRWENRVDNSIIWSNSADAVANQYKVSYYAAKSVSQTMLNSVMLPHTDRFTYPANTMSDGTSLEVSLKYFNGEMLGPTVTFSGVYLDSWYRSPGLLTNSTAPTFPLDRLKAVLYETFDKAGPSVGKITQIGSQSTDYYAQASNVAVATPLFNQGPFVLKSTSYLPVAPATRNSAVIATTLKAGVTYLIESDLYVPSATTPNPILMVFGQVESSPVTVKNAWQTVSISFTPTTTGLYYVGMAYAPLQSGEIYYMDRISVVDTTPPDEGVFEYQVYVADRVGMSEPSLPSTFSTASSSNLYYFDGSLWVPRPRLVYDGAWKEFSANSF